MSNADVRITTITLEIGKKVMVLSVEQAKELNRALNELLGGKDRVIKWWHVDTPIYPLEPNITWINTTSTTSDTVRNVTLSLAQTSG